MTGTGTGTGSGSGPGSGVDSAPNAPAPADRRGLRLAVVGCVVAAAVLLIVSGQAWLQVSLAAVPPLPAVRQSLTGQAVLSSLAPVGVLVGASGLALVATRRIGRKIVGVALVAAGLLAAGTVAFFLVDDGALAALNWAQGRSSAVGDSALPDREVAVLPALLAVVAALLALAIGVVSVLRSNRWPVMGARYERRSGTPAPNSDGDESDDPKTDGPQPRTGGSPQAQEAAMWAALERGEDPTARQSRP